MAQFEKLSGEAREAALADLTLDIQTGIPKDTSSEAVFAAKLADPAFPSDQWEVYMHLIKPIELASDPFKSNLLSPTPGDPASVNMEDGRTYEDGALDYMREKLDKSFTSLFVIMKGAKEQGFEHPLANDYRTILNEIEVQHKNEIQKNDAATRRLIEKYRSNPLSVKFDEADLIERVRGVIASSLDRLEIITLHPEMDAIEDAKLTCPLDYLEYHDAKVAYFEQLSASLAETDRFVVVRIDTKDQKPRPRILDQTISSSVVSTKTIIAEILDTETGIVIEVVEKLNQYAFPVDRSLPGVIARYVDAETLEDLPAEAYWEVRNHTDKFEMLVAAKNIQPIYMQICLRIKRDRTNEKEDKLNQAAYDASRLYIVESGIKRYIEDLK